jgi:glycosyltransferase involved in cell wall biosynthesis
MTAIPLVSIAMPIFNTEKTLASAIRSVLTQSYADWELLLIDDGSTDSTLSVARKFCDPRIRLIADGRRAGLAARLNQAIDLGKGKYLARMDGDDICFPERLERQVRYLEDNPNVDLLGTRAIVFAGDGIIRGVRPFRESHVDICKQPWAGFYLPHPTWMGKLEWFRRHRYRVDVFRAEDQDLLMRTYDSSTFACLPVVLLGYREGALSIWKTVPARFSFSKSLIRESIRRGNYWCAFIGPLLQAGKMLADILATVSGLSRLVLQRRAVPVGKMEMYEWGKVLARLQIVSHDEFIGTFGR